MRKNEEERGTRLVQHMSAVLLGGVIALLVCLVLLFLCSLAISAGWLADRSMLQYTLASCVLSCLIGGRYAVSRCRSRTLLVGLGTGAVFFLLLLTIGIIFCSDMSVENHAVGLVLASLAGGALAGLLGGRPKRKKRK